MTKIERKTQKIFAGNADTDELAVFGSMISGTPVYNDDIEALQSEAYTEGWKAAVAANEAPFMEEMNAVQYGFSKQLAYLFQQGIPEWDAGTTYYLNSFCQVGGVIYKSKLDENINHSPGDDTEEIYWTPFKAGDSGSGGLEVCDIGMALYVDETKGLRRRLNGTTVSVNTNTQTFVNKLKSIVALYPSLACTEAKWSQIESASDLGQVGKFVIQDAEEIQYYAYSSGSTTYLTTSTADSDSVNVYNTEFVLQGTGSISSDVLTYESQTYNRASGSDATQEIEAYVRLPKVVNIQGLIDLQNLGVTVAAGLPNITGQTQHIVSGNGATNASDKGALKTALIVTAASGLQEIVMPGRRLLGAITIDASLSNPIYGNSTTVQPEAIQYPYYIQIATGQETEVNITNEIELNNPFFFGMSNYFKFKPNSLSWLKSAGYDEPKAAHPDYYNWILENVNKGVKGFKGQEGYCFIATDSSGYYWWVSTESPVVGASVYRYDAGVNSMFFDGTVETLTSNGFTFTSIFEGSSYTVTRDSSKDTSILHPTAWITDNDFEINTSDETFRLPLKNGTEGMFGGGAVVGNGMSLGLTNGFQTAGLTSLTYHSGVTDRGTLIGVTTGYGLNIGQSVAGSAGFNGIVTAGITTDPEKSGLVVANAGVVPDGWSLYYYVGETVQNANLIDAGRMQEQITNINAPSRGYLVQSYVNGRSWYRVYSDGWCEQGGQITVTVAATNITLLKSYKDNNYNAVGCQANTDTAGYHTINVAAYSATQVQIRQNAVGSPLVNWIAMGYIK